MIASVRLLPRLALPRLAPTPTLARWCHAVQPPPQTFASLLRHCKLTQLGDPVGKVVVGMYFGLFSGLGLDSMLENKGSNDITLLILSFIPNYSQFIDLLASFFQICLPV